MNSDYLYNCIECRQDWAMEHLCHVCNPQEVKSFNIYNLLSEYSGGVLVPKIQRDYAQGRSEESDHGQAKLVRNDFLNYLFDNSKEEKSLDFVFGTTKQKDDKVWFIPVDGQQRLTTLWLLMLYHVKCIDTKDSQKYCECETCASLLKKFSYDTRRAARDFVKKIAEKEWDIKDRGKSDDVSYSLKICNWFMDYWQYDPTVDSMLRMLDAIHNLYKEKNCFPDLTNIKFYFFDMQAHGLDENLYLKMNSRGKPLTPFENLKANIEGLLKAQKGESPDCDNAFDNETDKNIPGSTFCEKWKYHLDRDWTDWFWENSKENNTIDKAFAQFICRFLAGYCKINYSAEVVYDKLDKKENESDEDFDKRKKLLFDELIKYLLSEYKENQNIDFEKIKPALRNDAFEAMAKVLMGFSKDRYLIQPYWDRNNCDLGEKKFNGNDKVKIEEYKQLAVIQSYLIADDKDDKERNAWMRFAWNMAENYVTGAENYKNFCEMLAVLRNQSKPLYEALLDSDLKKYSAAQLEEEIAKARQIVSKRKNPNSVGPAEDVIIQAESYAFFKGAIRFLFRDEKEDWNWKDFDVKWENAKKLIPISEENRHTIKELTPYLDEVCMKKIYFHWVSNKDEDLRTILLDKDGTECFHHFLLQDDKKNESLVHSNIISLCESQFKGRAYLRTNWDDAKFIWTNRASRHGYYDSECFVIGDEGYSEIANIIKKDYKCETERFVEHLYKGLHIVFMFKENYFMLSPDMYIYLCDKDKKRKKNNDKYINFIIKNNMSQDICDKLDELISQTVSSSTTTSEPSE